MRQTAQIIGTVEDREGDGPNRERRVSLPADTHLRNLTDRTQS